MRKLVRLNSDDVQGEGSWIELKAPSWAASRRFIGTQEGNEQERGLAMMEALVPLCVTGWNWTDDDGQVMELPADPELLTLDEMLWLIPHVSDFMTPAKNSETT